MLIPKGFLNFQNCIRGHRAPLASGVESPSDQAMCGSRSCRPIQNRGFMLKRISVLALAAAALMATGYADQTKKVVIPVHPTDRTDGKQMYTAYCAPCHGVDARGNGPVAPALNARPTDLTRLAIDNHGKYPDTHVVAVLRFGTAPPAHGSSHMPVWGRVLGNMSSVQSESERDLRTSNLSRYIQSIQVR